MLKNVGSQVIGVQMVSATDGSAFTGAVTVVITKDGGTQGASGGTGPDHEGNGYHSYVPTQAETNADQIAFTFTGSGAVPTTVQVYTGTPQTGDNFARIGAAGAGLTDLATAAALTTVDTEVGQVKAVTDALPDAGALTTIGTDTARLTAVRAAVLTDWINGGRLDLLLDAIPTTAMRGTDSAALASVCTEARLAELDAANLPTDVAAIPTTAMRGTDSAALASVCTEGRLAELDAGNLPTDVAAVNTLATAIKVITDALGATAAANLAKSASDAGIVSGAAEAGTLSTTQMTSNLTEATDDHYIGRTVIWTSGVLLGQASDITDYTGATGQVDYTATTEAPSATDTFIIV